LLWRRGLGGTVLQILRGGRHWPQAGGARQPHQPLRVHAYPELPWMSRRLACGAYRTQVRKLQIVPALGLRAGRTGLQAIHRV